MTSEMNETEPSRTTEKLERSEEKHRLFVRSELENDDKMEPLAERPARMEELEEELRKSRRRQEVSTRGIANAVASAFPALHALCIGPGLGRHPLVFSAAEKVMRKAMEAKLTLVLDADALFMLSLKEYGNLLAELRDYERCVMTPNLMEMRRLNEPTSDAENGVGEYANIVVQKGNADTITCGRHAMQCDEEGGLKRSGGIGDVLAGTICAFMAWNAILEKDAVPGDDVDGGAVNRRSRQRVFASWAACCAVKKGTNLAFRKKGRAMSAQDVIGEIGEVLGSMEGRG